MLHVLFTTDLGAKVTVDVQSPDQLLDVQRQYGRLGWTSGTTPNGGYQFPLENESNFDWSLIGARRWTSPDGEELIMHRGHAYRRRELEAVDNRKMKLPAAVKYSRGAKSTDPEHIREKADGEFEYVTLAIFRGGKRQEKYATPAGGPTSNTSFTPGDTDGRSRTAAAPGNTSFTPPRPAPPTAPRAAAPKQTPPQGEPSRGHMLNVINTHGREHGTLTELLAPYNVKAPSSLTPEQLRELYDQIAS